MKTHGQRDGRRGEVSCSKKRRRRRKKRTRKKASKIYAFSL
jgi:hypothetical protein